MIAYLSMAALTLLAALWLTRPWWSRAATPRLARREANIAAYRSRLAEMEADVASGTLDAAEAEAMKQELGARLLADAAVPERDPEARPARRGYRAALLLCGLMALVAAGGYFAGDSWRVQRAFDRMAAHPDQAQGVMIEAMIDGLKARLKKSPEDADGWGMLGRSQFAMQRYDEAAAAYAKANAISGEQNASWLVGEGESLAMAHQRDLTGLPAQRFEQALKLEPDSGKALWYAGLAAAQSQDYQRALKYWLQLRQQSLPPELADALEQRLQELAQLSGLKVPAKTVVAAVQLKVKVSLDPALLPKVPQGATLFVYARAADGPPMPLAVRKLDAAQLPVEVTLDDSMAMTPAMRLSQFPRWQVIARISASGTAQAQPGDLQGQLAVTRADAAQPVAVVIGEVVR